MNEVTRGYCEALKIPQLREPTQTNTAVNPADATQSAGTTQTNTTVNPSGASQSAGATQGSVNLDYFDFGKGY